MEWLEIIEIVAVVFGVFCVFLTIRQNIWCWPTGLIQVLLFIFIFYKVKLYSDLILHIIYVWMQIYGWYFWVHGGVKNQRLAVTKLNNYQRLQWSAVAIVVTAVWGLMMGLFTDASLPRLDAFTTVTSLVAQWLMAQKKLESWLFWITVDIFAIGIYWYKELYFTSGLYAVFLVLATAGWFAWSSSWRETK